MASSLGQRDFVLNPLWLSPGCREEGTGVDRAGTFVEHHCSDRTPYETRVFEEEIARAHPPRLDGKPPGYTAIETPFRTHFCADLLAKDTGHIPADKEFKHYVPCGMAHPGLCATKDKAIMESVEVGSRAK